MVWLFVGLGGISFVAAARFAWHRRQLGRGAAQELESLRAAVSEDIALFEAEFRRLRAAPGSPDYDLARQSYESALAASRALDRPASAAVITEALADGQYAVLRHNAFLAHQPLPDRRVPCFFNPQHGPSQADVRWNEPGRGTRRLPACAEDIARIEAGDQPLIRYVPQGTHQVPYWNAGSTFAPYALGYFANAGEPHRFLLTNFAPQDTLPYGDPRHRHGRSPYPLEPPN